MKKQLQVLCRSKIQSGKICLFYFAFIFMHFFAAAQNRVSGTVTDDQGKPMAGVSVKIKGRQSGTTTRDNGTYELDAPSNAILVFSSVGFDETEEKVGTGKLLSVSLQKAVTDLNEVVVVGYGTVRKKDLTGSVTALKREDFNQGPVLSADQLIAGKASGVQVVQSSAEPGGGISVNIRGAGSINADNSPLYVIDGLALDNSSVISGSGANFLDSRTSRNPLNSINPADIQSIEILKDASATAIYGSRGANGVVIITTKGGARGGLRVSYDAYTGLQNVANKIRLLSPEQYMNTINSLIDAGAGTPDQKVTQINNGGTDWLKELYNPNAGIQNHNLSFSGGNESTSFLVSLNYFDQAGVLINSNYKRVAGRINLEHRVQQKFKLGINLSTSYGKDKFVSNGFDLNERAGVLYAALNYDPTLTLRAPSGRYTLSNDMNIDNPLAIANGKQSFSNLYRTFGTVYAEYAILPELKARLNVGGDVVNQRRDAYIDRSTIEGLAAGGIATALQGRNSNYLVEGTLSYNKQFKKHSVNAVIGTTAQRFMFDDLSGEARGFPSDATGTDNMSLGNPAFYRSTTGRSSNSLLSYLGRINYTFLDRYLLTTSFRMDGSSRFGANNKYGYFPSLALGWNLDQEKFMQSQNMFSSLKLRASWGRTGNQDIGNNMSMATFGAGNQAVFNDIQVTTTTPVRVANPDIKWEASEQMDIGIDFGLFNNRITGTVDWYTKNTRDMLLSLPIPRETGFTAMLTNVGSVNNTGIDFSLSSKNFTGAFTWTTDVTLTTLKNTVKNLGGIANIITGSAGQSSQIGIIQVGSPLYSFYGYDVVGIWQMGDDLSGAPAGTQPGDFRFRDVNNDKLVNVNDRVVLGNSFPKLLYSMTNNFSYKNFSLYVFFEGVEGVKMLNNNLVDTYFPANTKRNRLAAPLLNRWTPSNPTNEYPSFVNSAKQGAQRINSRTIEDASYLKLNTLKLAYTLKPPTGFVKGATIYVTGQNLVTWTKYTGYDPALNPNDVSNFRIDWNAYPTARTFLFGVSVNL
ncbi:MAG TPA: TonB-dependent receptor [Chitinophagaceae bacterium]|nr:TonB-dependent receptor [Chitinophagaceae bacterium]